MKAARLFFIGISVILSVSMAVSSAQTTVPKAKLPVLTTSAGQSNDVTTVNIVLEEAEE